MPDAELLPLHPTAIRALLAVVSQVRPNFRSVANAAGVASTNTIDAHLRRLRAMGLVDWEEHRSGTLRALVRSVPFGTGA